MQRMAATTPAMISELSWIAELASCIGGTVSGTGALLKAQNARSNPRSILCAAIAVQMPSRRPGTPKSAAKARLKSAETIRIACHDNYDSSGGRIFRKAASSMRS